MKFKVQSKALYSALSSVSKVINTKNALTILNNFLFEVEENEVIVTASDVENTLKAHVAITDFEGEPTKFCVDARRCVELFKELPDVAVRFSVDENLAIVIDYYGDTFDFVGVNGDEYPRNNDVAGEDAVAFECPAEQICTGIDKTFFAVGNDDLRPQMMGVYFDIKDDGITFVATDTRKLVKYRNWMSAPGVNASCIVPAKPANIIRNTFNGEGNISVIIDSKSATISNEKFTFTCRLIKGVFPDYNRVIPSNNPYTLTVDRASLLKALRRVAVFVDPGHGLVKFRITPEKIEMKAQDVNFCTSGRVEVPCDFTGNELVIGFSAPFLIDIFSVITTENALVRLSDPSRPGVFLPDENSENSELLMLLMPMTVTSF